MAQRKYLTCPASRPAVGILLQIFAETLGDPVGPDRQPVTPQAPVPHCHVTCLPSASLQWALDLTEGQRCWTPLQARVNDGASCHRKYGQRW